MMIAGQSMLHSLEENQNKEEMNVKSLSYHFAITHCKCTLMRQECSSVDIECTNEVSSVRKISLNLLDYGLMLPYSKMGFPFQRRSTLVYSDWDILLCDNNDPDSCKGPVSVHFPLFKCDVL